MVRLAQEADNGLERWYSGRGGNMEAVRATVDDTGRVTGKVWLRWNLSGCGPAAFSGAPSVKSARYPLLEALPTVVSCEFEGFVRADGGGLGQWRTRPRLLLTTLFPRAERGLQAGGDLTVHQVTWGQYAGERTVFLRIAEQPNSGLSCQITMRGDVLRLRGFAYALWPQAAVVGWDTMRDPGGTVLGDVLGWAWYQGLRHRQGNENPSWDEYLHFRKDCRRYVLWYSEYRMDREWYGDSSGSFGETPYAVYDYVHLYPALKGVTSVQIVPGK